MGLGAVSLNCFLLFLKSIITLLKMFQTQTKTHIFKQKLQSHQGGMVLEICPGQCLLFCVNTNTALIVKQIVCERTVCSKMCFLIFFFLNKILFAKPTGKSLSQLLYLTYQSIRLLLCSISAQRPGNS